jgi:hypothetical protein
MNACWNSEEQQLFDADHFPLVVLFVCMAMM